MKSILIEKRSYKLKGYEPSYNPIQNFVLFKRGSIGYYLENANKAYLLTKFDFSKHENVDLKAIDLKKFGVGV